MSIEKLSRQVLEKGRMCEYRKMVESGRVPGKDRIRASIDNLRRGVPEKG